MTPEQKAKELIEKFKSIDGYEFSECELMVEKSFMKKYKKQSFMLVDEILELDAKDEEDENKWMCIAYNHHIQFTEFWQSVRTEITNIKN